ncbi:MAG: hypothetical protein IAG10_22255, partial [Planctomycetaceae bacterium]|nr:hypothetical protein [Planctomycetaceae bacterium]
MNTGHVLEISQLLTDLKAQLPDYRFGQMLGALDVLSEDMFDRSLWDVKDDQLVEVIERFQADLARREAP